MSITMYRASVPVFIRALTNLKAVLQKGEAHAEAKKFKPEVLLNDRLCADMFPLTRQVQIATDHAKGCAARLAAIDPPKFEDNETTIDQLKDRIARTLAHVKTLDRAAIDASGGLPDGSRFADVDGLEAAILRRPELFVSTLTEKLTTYALGRGVEYYDMPAIRTIVRDAAKQGDEFGAYVTGITHSAAFQMTKSAPQVTEQR